jgi:hypothetical protein
VEQPVEAKNLPKPVAEAIAKQYPKATVKSAEETVKEGKASYAVLLENDVMIGKEKQKVQMALSATGEIRSTQKLIVVKDLPQAVTEALGKKYPNLPIVRANEARRDGKTTFLAILESADKIHLAVLDPEGKILREQDQAKKKK